MLKLNLLIVVEIFSFAAFYDTKALLPSNAVGDLILFFVVKFGSC